MQYPFYHPSSFRDLHPIYPPLLPPHVGTCNSIAHLAGFARLGEDQSPGRGLRFFNFFWGPERKKKNLKPLYPFFSKKVCKVCKVCSTLFTTPLRPASYPPPFTSPLYQLPPEALNTLGSGGPMCSRLSGIFFLTRAALGRRTSRRTRASSRRMPLAPCTAPSAWLWKTVVSPLVTPRPQTPVAP